MTYPKPWYAAVLAFKKKLDRCILSDGASPVQMYLDLYDLL